MRSDRKIRSCFAAAAMILIAAGANGAAAADPRSDESPRPNVLVILSCQHSAWAMSGAGSETIDTPNLDALAARGVRFDTAYTTQPLCQPARVSLAGGRMPHELGMTRNGAVRRVRADPAIGSRMAGAGYDTGWIGKWHLVPDAGAGFEHVEKFKHDDAKVAARSARFLDRRRDRPFFLVASFMRTHDACQYARKLGGYPKRTKLPGGPLEDPPPEADLPPLPENFPIPPREPNVLRDIVWPADPPAYPLRYAGVTEWRELRWAYGRLVEQMDAHIGRLLDHLRESGQQKNTLVVYLSGHGDGSGAHRWNQKQVLYDEAARVPFIVAPPAGSKADAGAGAGLGRVSDRPVSAELDLLPTVCDYAGVETPGDLNGRSVRPLVEGREPDRPREFVVCETTFGDWGKSFGVSGRMVRTSRYKYVVYNKGKHREQLFDMREDPGEMRDLAEDRQHRPILKKHRRLLRRWCERTDDPFADRVPGGSAKRNPEKTH